MPFGIHAMRNIFLSFDRSPKVIGLSLQKLNMAMLRRCRYPMICGRSQKGQKRKNPKAVGAYIRFIYNIYIYILYIFTISYFSSCYSLRFDNTPIAINFLRLPDLFLILLHLLILNLFSFYDNFKGIIWKYIIIVR